MSKIQSNYYDVVDYNIKNGEAEFLIAFTDDESVPAVAIDAVFSAYASKSECIAEDVCLYVNGNEINFKSYPRLVKRYGKLWDYIEEKLNDWVQENAEEIFQARIEMAADHAYESWREQQTEMGE